MLWLAGNRRSDTLKPTDERHRGRPLWLAGNRRSDTLPSKPLNSGWLWLAGNRRSDTLLQPQCAVRPSCGLRGIVARIHWSLFHPPSCCGLRGIVARIHFLSTEGVARPCCGLRGIVARIHSMPRAAPICTLWLAGNRRSDTLLGANVHHAKGVVACGESSLGYTKAAETAAADHALWLAGNRRSDTLR